MTCYCGFNKRFSIHFFHKIFLFRQACFESTDLTQQPLIAGATWDFTNNWDCGGNDIESHHVTGWGKEGSVEARRSCAERCLKLPNCVAFNFPNSPRSSGNCYMKHTYQKSTSNGRNWNCGGAGSAWQYYTLIDKKPDCTGVIRFGYIALQNLRNISKRS